MHHNAIPKTGRSLADVSPHVAAELDPSLNDGLTASSVAFASGKKLVWRCGICNGTWVAKVSHRTTGRRTGCPHCSRPWISLEEIRFRAELIAAGVPVSDQAAVVADGRSLQCDVLAEKWRVVVEFDGNYWHRGDAKAAHDRAKTEALTAAGYTVVRVREDLPAIGTHDVIVPLGSNEVERAKATLLALATLGFKAQHHDEYLGTSEPWAPAGEVTGKRPPAHRSLATCNPAVARQWDIAANWPLTPRDVTVKSNRTVWWICQAGHRTQSRVFHRTRATAVTGCKHCRIDARRRLTPDLIEVIRADYATGEWTQRQVAQRHGVSNGLVWRALRA